MPSVRRALAIVAVVFVAGRAKADATAKECGEAYVGAQHDMHDGKLIEAREKLLVCARDPCAKALRPECTQWLADVEKAMPSIVIAAKSGKGDELHEVTVTIDGAPFVDRLDGVAKDVDPGLHVFKLTTNGEPPVEQKVLVREGEKARVVAFVFGPETPAPSASPTTTTDETPTIVDEHRGPSRTPAWIALGVGVAATGAFAYFGLKGLSQWNDCHDGCAQSHVDDGNHAWIGADVSLGVALVSFGVATYFFLRHDDAPSPTTSTIGAGVAPVRGGAAASMGFTF